MERYRYGAHTQPAHHSDKERTVDIPAWLLATYSRLRGENAMFRYTLSYARYILTALSTVAFKLAAN
jgi:hypothetical protein